MICLFLKLKAPIWSSKRIENSTASVKSKIRFITPAKKRFPGQLDTSAAFTARPTQWSPASAIARSSRLATEAEFPGKWYS